MTRTLTGLACAAAVLTAGVLAPADVSAQAQRYPERPVRIVVPFPAAGAADFLARMLAQEIGEWAGQPVIVENRPGAAAALGADYVARSAPDGHTLLLGATSSHSIGPAVAKLSYDPVTDFLPVTMIAYSAFVIAVSPDLPVRSTADLITVAKARPGKLDMASFGNGSASHLFGELFKARAGIYMLHVPYRGSPPALIDLMAGRVQVMFDNLSSVLPHAQSGKLRALAVTTASRSLAAPDLPTVAETLPGYEATGWFGLFAPAGTPRVRIESLNARVNQIIADPRIRQRLVTQGMDAAGSSSAEFAALVSRDLDKWRGVIKEAGLRFD